MKEWVTQIEAAELEDITKMTVYRYLKKGKYSKTRTIESKGGRGGTRTEIHISCLSEAAQARCCGTLLPSPSCPSPSIPSTSSSSAPDSGALSSPEIPNSTTPEHPVEGPRGGLLPTPCPSQEGNTPCLSQEGKTKTHPGAYWLTVSQVAALEHRSPRTIRRWAEHSTVEHHTQNPTTGEHYIHLHSLSPAAQTRWYVTHNLPIPDSLKHRFVRPLDEIPARDRDTIATWLTHIEHLEHYMAQTGHSLTTACQKYAEHEDFSPATLQHKYQIYHHHGVAALASHHHHKGRKKTDIPQAAIAWLYKHYLESGFPNKSLSARATILKSTREDWGLHEGMERTLIRRLNDIPADVIAKYQYGGKTFRDALPSMLRKYDFAPMHVWVCDNHQFNVAVLTTKGTVIFPWLCGWMDMKTRRLVGYDIVIQPNTDTVSYAYYLGCKRFGSPQHGLLDNGKDMKSYKLVGLHRKRTKFQLISEQEQMQIRGAFQATGMKPHFAIPYNAKTKPIERMFRTHEESFCGQLPGWRGRNVLERPERLADQITHKDLLHIDDFSALATRWIEEVYHATMHHKGRGINGRTPLQCWHDEYQETGRVPEANLRLLLMRFKGHHTVQKNGINVFGQWYRFEDPELHLHLKGKRLWVRYDPHDLSEITCYDFEHDTYISTAPLVTLAGFIDEDALKQHKKQEKAYKEAIAWYYEQQEIAQAAAMTLEERVGLPPEPPTDTPTDPPPKILRLVPKITNSSPSTPSISSIPSTPPGMDHDIQQYRESYGVLMQLADDAISHNDDDDDTDLLLGIPRQSEDDDHDDDDEQGRLLRRLFQKETP